MPDRAVLPLKPDFAVLERPNLSQLIHQYFPLIRVEPVAEFDGGSSDDFREIVTCNIEEGIVGIDDLSIVECSNADSNGTRSENRRKMFFRCPQFFGSFFAFCDILYQNLNGGLMVELDRNCHRLNVYL